VARNNKTVSAPINSAKDPETVSCITMKKLGTI